jgi:hypothetical protein
MATFMRCITTHGKGSGPGFEEAGGFFGRPSDGPGPEVIVVLSLCNIKRVTDASLQEPPGVRDTTDDLAGAPVACPLFNTPNWTSWFAIAH